MVGAEPPAAEAQGATESAEVETAAPVVENVVEVSPGGEAIVAPTADAAASLAVIATPTAGIRHNPLVPGKRMRAIR